MFEFYQHNDLDTIRFYPVDRRKYQNVNSSKHYGYTKTNTPRMAPFLRLDQEI